MIHDLKEKLHEGLLNEYLVFAIEMHKYNDFVYCHCT